MQLSAGRIVFSNCMRPCPARFLAETLQKQALALKTEQEARLALAAGQDAVMAAAAEAEVGMFVGLHLTAHLTAHDAHVYIVLSRQFDSFDYLRSCV